MEKETIERKLRYEIELLKIYALFIALTGTGTSSLLFRTNVELAGIVFYLLILGSAIFCIFVYMGIVSYIRIKNLYNKLS